MFVFTLNTLQVDDGGNLNENLKKVVLGEDNLLKDAIREGDLQSINQLVTSISSLLNYESRKVNPDRNVSESEETQIQQQKQERMVVSAL